MNIITSIKSARYGGSRKGFYTVEAAIFLPVFIVAILTLSYFIKVIGAVEQVVYIGVDESRYAAAQAYVVKGSWLLGPNVKERIEKECEDVGLIEAFSPGVLMDDGQMDGLITLYMDFQVPIKLPLNMVDSIELKEKIKCRGWIGQDNSGETMSYDDMEREGTSKRVWVFPRSGEKYHKDDCTYVTNLPVEVVLNKNLKKNYKSCSHCNSKELNEGAVVYCFQKYGQAYHKGQCDQVTKYVVPMDEEDAKAKGYSPCSKCGG